MNRKNIRLVGAYIPENEYNAFTIACLSRATTKADTLREVIRTWLKTQTDTQFEQLLSIARRYAITWKAVHLARTPITFEQYITQIRSDLSNKGLTTKQIDIVINSIQQ